MRDISQKTKRFITKLSIAFIILFILFKIPISWFIDEPYRTYNGAGNPNNISDFVLIDKKRPESNFYISYVRSLRSDSFFSEFFVKSYNFFNKEQPFKIIPYEENSIPKNMTYEDVENYYKNETKYSLNDAVYVAYKEVDKELKIKKEGLLITHVYENGIYNREDIGLKVGDYILKVENKNVSEVDDITKITSEYNEGNTLNFLVLRDDKEITVKHSLVNEDGKLKIGIFIEPHIEFDIPANITFEQDSMRGSSAGLLFSLYLIDQLTPDSDLSKGYKITGTGTIDKDGNVGQIDGIVYKLQGAIANDFDYFFVPKDITKGDTNEKKAKDYLKKNKSNIKIVPVSNINEALEFLNGLKVI